MSARVCRAVCAGPRTCYDRIQESLKISPGETTPDQEVTLTEVECLCACEMAPMAQLDERFVGPLEGGAIDTIIQDALDGTGEPAIDA